MIYFNLRACRLAPSTALRVIHSQSRAFQIFSDPGRFAVIEDKAMIGADFAAGVATNATWDLLKHLYSKTKFDLDRRIGSEPGDFEFDTLDQVIGNALDILAGAGTSTVSRASNIIHAWLVNVPDDLRRDNVREWLTSAVTRADCKELITRLLSAEEVEDRRSKLVGTLCAWTGDSADQADHQVRMVVRFIGETIQQTITVGDGVIISTTKRVHETLAGMEARLNRKIDSIAGDVFLLRVFHLRQKAEAFLRTRFHAKGNGLSELTKSAAEPLRAFDSRLALALDRFAPVFSRVTHDTDAIVVEQEFAPLIADLDRQLLQYVPNEPGGGVTLALRPRQWIVCSNGLGDFESLSAAVAAASTGDLILILPGTYSGPVSVDKPLSLVGRGHDPSDVKIVGQDDLLAVGSRDVTLENISLFADEKHTFCCVALPGTVNLRISGCAFSSPNGEGLVAMHGSDLAVDSCHFQQCRVAARLDSIAMLTGISFVENDHGVLSRAASAVALAQCSFERNQIDLEIQDNASVQVHANDFRDGKYAIVAYSKAKGRIFSNRFFGYEANERLVRINGAEGLAFED